jgi:hypothetical protein
MIVEERGADKHEATIGDQARESRQSINFPLCRTYSVCVTYRELCNTCDLLEAFPLLWNASMTLPHSDDRRESRHTIISANLK